MNVQFQAARPTPTVAANQTARQPVQFGSIKEMVMGEILAEVNHDIRHNFRLDLLKTMQVPNADQLIADFRQAEQALNQAPFIKRLSRLVGGLGEQRKLRKQLFAVSKTIDETLQAKGIEQVTTAQVGSKFCVMVWLNSKASNVSLPHQYKSWKVTTGIIPD